ncbi:MAG: hypothetical protein ACREO9_12035, partial [Lysobacterales bacterium]
FQVERLQCIGGEGRAAPYRITTYPGRDLGYTGAVTTADLEAANAGEFERRANGLMSQDIFRIAGRLLEMAGLPVKQARLGRG